MMMIRRCTVHTSRITTTTTTTTSSTVVIVTTVQVIHHQGQILPDIRLCLALTLKQRLTRPEQWLSELVQTLPRLSNPRLHTLLVLLAHGRLFLLLLLVHVQFTAPGLQNLLTQYDHVQEGIGLRDGEHGMWW